MDYLQEGIKDLDAVVKKEILFKKIQEIIHWINTEENNKKNASRILDRLKAKDIDEYYESGGKT